MAHLHIVAYERRHAEAAFAVLKQEGVCGYSYVHQDEYIRSLKRGSEVIIIEAPRYVPNQRQRDTRRQIVQIIYHRDLVIKRVRLP